MYRRNRMPRIGLALSGSALAVALLFQLGCPAVTPTPTPPPSKEGVSANQVRDLLADKLGNADRSFTLWDIQPGLGTVMIEYGRRFALTQLAAQAGDWGMAQYQLKEATEIQEVGEVTRPTKADLLKGFEQTFLDPLAEDILNEDITAFNADATAAIAGCNACHVSTDHPFIVVQPPTASPEDFLVFSASNSVPPSSSSTTPAAAPGSDAALSWAELNQMVDEAFDTVNRDMTLWNIQPGLGTVMIEYGRRFAMLKFAVDVGDWGMAHYQLDEQIEIQEVGETTRPAKADLLKNFEQTFLNPLDAAIEAQDSVAFNTAYTQAIGGCNACHIGTGNAFVRVTMPPTLPQPFLFLSSNDIPMSNHDATTPPPPATFPPGNPTLADADTLIQDRLNTLDRTLALWNIQPGLGTIMMEYGYRFALARLAADVGNWGMAAYQIKEATEIQEVGEITRPNNAALLKDFENTFLEPVNVAIAAQDATQFDTAYGSAINGCNACHQATGHPFVVFQEPPTNLVDFLDLAGGS